jgi:hypothetical protein
VVYNWDPDVPVPAGYELIQRPNGKLIGSGIGMLSSGWVTAMLIGVIAAEVEGDDPGEDGVTSADWTPMYIPVAGPFVTIGTADVRPSVMGLLFLTGIVQTAGVLGIVLGATVRENRLVRSETVSAGVEVAPVVSAGFQGLSATGHF